MIEVPLKDALFVTVNEVAAASVIVPALVSTSESAVLVPVITVSESSLIDTAPAALNVSEPKFVVSPASSPSVIADPLRFALLVTVREVPAASVIAPALVRTSESAVFVPLISVAESSVMTTAPALLNVSDPKFVVSPPLSPNVIVVPLNDALFVTVNEVPAASVIAPALVNTSESAVFVPVISVAESSVMTTLPALLNVSDPKFVVSPASSPSVIEVPLRDALFVTVSEVPAASVSPPALVSTSESAVLVPVTSVAEFSVIDTAPAELNVSVPKSEISPALCPQRD